MDDAVMEAIAAAAKDKQGGPLRAVPGAPAPIPITDTKGLKAMFQRIKARKAAESAARPS